MMDNNFVCNDIFEIRISVNSIQFGERLDKYSYNCFQFIRDNELEEEIYTSSKDLYSAFLRDSFNEKTNESLYKYLLRSWCRPTPYGELAGITQGKFGDNSCCRIMNKRKKIRVDMQWLIKLLLKLENVKGQDLIVFTNKTITTDNEYIYNNWTSCFYADERYIQNAIYIKNDFIIRTILEKAENGVTIRELLEDYSNAKQERMICLRSINFLIQNEFLLSEFHFNLLNNNIFERILQNSYFDFENLAELQSKISQAQSESNIELIQDIEKDMQHIDDSTKYLNIDTLFEGNFLLNRKIKNDIEELCDFLSLFSEDIFQYENFVNWYYETNKGALLKVKDIMNEVNRLGYYEILSDLNRADSNRENLNSIQLIEYIRENIQAHQLSLDDIAFERRKKRNTGKFEINLQLLEKGGEIYPFVPYSYGSTTQYAFSSKYFLEDNVCLDEESNLIDVEITFWPKSRKVTNVMQLKSPYKYMLVYGAVGDNNNQYEINIDDIYLGIINKQIYFYSKKLKKQLVFHVTSKVNYVYYPIMVRFLCSASGTMDNSIFCLFNHLEKIIVAHHHIARITYKNYILFPEQWIIKKGTMDFMTFKNTIRNIVTCYEIVLYGDEYLFLDLRRNDHLKILYNEYTKKVELRICENLCIEYNSLIKDSEGESHLGEYVFQVSSVNERCNGKNFANRTSILELEQRKKHTFLPVEEWIFCKIYTKKNYENEILIKHISPLMDKLINNGCVRGYYYVRYFEDNSHTIRLKILAKLGREIDCLKELKDLQKKIYALNLTNRCVIDTYEQEIMRYGGKEIYNKVEEFFFLNSKMNIKLLKKFQEKRASNILEDVIMSIITMINSTELSNKIQSRILDIKECTRKETKNYKELKRKIWRSLIEETYKNNFDVDSDMYKQKRLLTEIIEDIQTTSDDTAIYEIFADIIHMHINRLCGINKEKEIEIVNYCYLLIKSLEAYHKYN